MKRIRALLPVLLVALVTGAWVVKETKQDEDADIWVNDGGVMTKALSIDGATSVVSLSQPLPASSGGAGRVLTPVAGGMCYSDADSLELTAAGTTSQWVLSGGSGAPTMSNTTTTAKTIDGSVDAVQLTVQGAASQVSDSFVVENSSGTNILEVKGEGATGGSRVELRGIGTSTAAATGFVGELTSLSRSRSTLLSLTTSVSADITGSPLTLSAGDWDMQACVTFITASATSLSYIALGISTTPDTLPSSSTIGQWSSAGEFTTVQSFAANVSGNTDHVLCTGVVPVRLNASESFDAVVFAVFSGGSTSAAGQIWARRVR